MTYRPTQFFLCMCGLMLLLFATGCSRSMVGDPVISKYGNPKYQIELEYSDWGAGGPCTGLQLPEKYTSSYYIYVDQNAGKIDANHIRLTHEQGHTEYPWIQSNLKGFIEIKDGHIELQLETPYYGQDSKIKKYVQFELNGIYNLRVLR